jgi:hypothetical protein
VVAACLAIRFSVGCALIIPMIIQTILLDPSGAVWTDEASNVSRLDPSGADQADAENPTRNRKVEGSNPSSGSKTAGQKTFLALLAARREQAVIPLGRSARRRRARSLRYIGVCPRAASRHRPGTALRPSSSERGLPASLPAMNGNAVSSEFAQHLCVLSGSPALPLDQAQPGATVWADRSSAIAKGQRVHPDHSRSSH